MQNFGVICHSLYSSHNSPKLKSVYTYKMVHNKLLLNFHVYKNNVFNSWVMRVSEMELQFVLKVVLTFDIVFQAGKNCAQNVNKLLSKLQVYKNIRFRRLG